MVPACYAPLVASDPRSSGSSPSSPADPATALEAAPPTTPARPASSKASSSKPARRKPGPAPLTVYESAFIDAYLGQAKYSTGRAAKLVGLSETYASRLMSEPRIQMAIRYRLRGKILPADAIKAELSDVAACEFREGVKDRDGKPIPSVGAQHKVKALEILARIQGLDRDPALVVLERLMIVQASGENGREGGRSAANRQLSAGDPLVIDAELIDSGAALDEGAELAARARADEEARKVADAASTPTAPPSSVGQAEPELPPLRLPSPPDDDEDHKP